MRLCSLALLVWYVILNVMKQCAVVRCERQVIPRVACEDKEAVALFAHLLKEVARDKKAL